MEEEKLVEIRKVEMVVQQLVINGVPQNITQEGYVLACPKCGRVIYQFPVGISESQAYQAKHENIDELNKMASYCPTCGVKLSYGVKDIIDVEILQNDCNLSQESVE